MEFVKRNLALATACLALIMSGCQAIGVNPLPNPYQDVQSVSEGTLATIKSFGAVQDTLIDTCSEAVSGSPEGDSCVGLIRVEQTLRPAVTAAAQIGAEYADIDVRIKELGNQAPAEWIALAADAAGRLAAVYDPVKQSVDEFINNAGALVN